MKDKIKDIIDSNVFPERGSVHYYSGPDVRIADAAEAIVKFVEQQPVDRVRAMAALVGYVNPEVPHALNVPGANGLMYRVVLSNGERCHCIEPFRICGDRECDHIQAAKLYLEQQKGSK